MTDFGIAGVAAITVIAYLFGMFAKIADFIPDKFIPIICGVVGAIFGIVAFYVMPDFPAKDIITALAIGVVSGLSATGVNQIVKQLSTDENMKLSDALDELTNGKGEE